MKALSKDDRAAMYRSRIEAAKSVYVRSYTNWKVLEDALAGVYPKLMPNAVPTTDGRNLLYISDQININVLLRIANYMVSLAFDDKPSLRFSRQPDEGEQVVIATERLAEMLLDEGDMTVEGRRALRYLMTRGSWIMWVLVASDTSTAEEIRAQKINPADFVAAARAGQLQELPEGVDYYAIAQAAFSILEEPSLALGLTPEEGARISALAEKAMQEHEKRLKGPHPVGTRAKIQFQATPYGSWCLWDPTVTDVSKAGWIARKIVLDYDEFLDDPAFTAEAKKNIKPVVPVATEDPTLSAAAAETTSEQAIEQIGRVALWEIWDKRTWKRHYISEQAPGFLEVDDTYPYLDEEGKPLFKNFYPCVIRTPLQHNREAPEQSLGIPFLAPAWPLQLELIRTRTAYYQACKRSGRTLVASANADPDTLNAAAEGRDGAIVKSTAAYDRQKDGPLLERIDWGNAPIDYLQASVRIMADIANVSGVSLAALTGEPVADTLGQEEIALKGSTITQADVIRNLESGVAELAQMALILFRAYASEPEIYSYLGAKSDEVVNGKRVIDAFRAMDLTGRDLICKFASSTRAEELSRIKQRMDFFVMSNGPLGRDSTGLPYFDPKSQILAIAKEMDIEGLAPYQPSQAEMIAAVLTKVAATQQGNGPPNDGDADNRGPGGGDTTGRKAGGQRGEAGIPGRQQRHRDPQTSSQATGVAMRPKTALA